MVLPLLTYVLLLSHQPSKLNSSSFIVKINTELITNYELDGDEIIINGNYYDILSKEKTAKGYIYTCVDDKKETNYISQIKKENNSNHRNTDAKISVFIDEHYESNFTSLPLNIFNTIPIFRFEENIYNKHISSFFVPPCMVC